VPLFAGRTVEEPTVLDRLLGSPLLIIGLPLLIGFAILGMLLLARRRRKRNARKKLKRVLRTRR